MKIQNFKQRVDEKAALYSVGYVLVVTKYSMGLS